MKKERPLSPSINLSSLGQAIADTIGIYSTENRLRAVISKIYPITQRDFGKLNGLFVQDILSELEKEFADFNTLEKVENKEIQRLINLETQPFIRQHFINIIDGEF